MFVRRVRRGAAVVVSEVGEGTGGNSWRSEMKLRLLRLFLGFSALGAGDVQQMMRITKMENEVLKEEVFENFSFVPMLKGKKE